MLRSTAVRMIFGLAAMAASSQLACEGQVRPAEVSAKDAAQLLTQTPWLDHLPAHEGDTIDLLQLDRRGQGVYVHGNAYRGSYEVFQYEATRDELRLRFLDGGERAKTGYRIERIKRQGFDLRLTLTDSPRGPAAYYGFDSRRAVPAAVRAVLPPQVTPAAGKKAAR